MTISQPAEQARRARPQSPYRVQRGRRQIGIWPGPRDATMLKFLARWYCGTASQVARSINPVSEWADLDRITLAARRRLSELSAVIPGVGVGPLAGRALGPTHTVWHATRRGGEFAGMPWTVDNSISPHLSMHALMAVDVGLQLETAGLGYRVLSQREVVRGVDINGDQVPSGMRSESSAGRWAEPDLVVLAAPHTGSDRFLAVEVERTASRSLKVYRDKLTAYDENPAVAGVLYACASEAIAARVRAAATEVFSSRTFPLSVRFRRDSLRAANRARRA